MRLTSSPCRLGTAANREAFRTDEDATLHTHYHVPASMTGAGCVVMENA